MRFRLWVNVFFSTILTGMLFAQNATFTTIPAAVNGTINVCAGSTILFNSTVNPATLFSPAIYSWNFGNGQTSSIPGPVGITYATPGTYTVTLNISSAGVPLTPTTITVNVSAVPGVVPTFTTVGTVNSCEQLSTVNGIPMIQTTGTNCNCPQYSGPMISLNNANLLPAGSTATIHWGVNGLGGTTTTFPIGASNLLNNPFINFPGQQNPGPFSHYSTPGSYNLMYLVTYPNGCTYSTYVIMSYGAGAISLGTLSAQTQCNPLNYILTFANQTPGNTYVINWGDGTPNATYTYPNLPLVPNGVLHQYSPSACVNGVPQSYTITVTATNPCPGSTTTSTIGPFNVNALPLAAFTSVPGNSICQNQSITFTNTSNGGLSINNGQCSNAYNFGWQIDYSSSLSGAGYQITSGTTGDAFNTPPINGSGVITVQFTQPGTYSVSLDAVNSACGNDNETQTITVNPIPIVPNQTATICSGNTFVIVPQNNPPTTVVPNGTSYTWVPTPNPNVVGEVNGTNDSIIGTLVNTSNVNQTVIYTVTPTVNGCQGAPFTVSVTVIPAVVIPNFTQTICNGGTFSVNPTNAPPVTIIPNGTTFAWTVVDNPNVTGESNGSGLPLSQTLTSNVASPVQNVVYTVTATAPGGNCPNTVFTVTVNINVINAPVIAGSLTICSGGNPPAFTNTTAATGSGTLGYQWQSSTTSANAGFTNIGGATAATYDPPILNATTYYQVIVTSTLNGILCTATSNPLTVTVNNVSAGTLSQSQTICSGGNALAFTTITAATGTGTLSYQWQSSTVSAVAGFSNMVGETNPTYDPPAGQTVTTFYQLVVTSTLNGIVCIATSNVLSVSVNNIAASVIATNQTICSGGNPAAFTNTTAASGTGTLSYVWQSSTVSAVAGFNPIVGATSSTYDPPAGLNTTTYYQVIITSTLNGVSCNAISNPVTVNVNSVTAQTVASNQTICSNGDPVAFTVTTPSVGAGALSYQWQVSTTGVAVGYANVAGQTNPTYDVPAGLNVTSYYQVITSSVLNGVTCTSTSNPITVFVNNVNAGALATNQTICSGGNPNAFTVSTAASGTGTLTYQWQSSTVSAVAGFNPIVGATSATYDPPAGLNTTTYYQLVVTSTLNGLACSATSAALTVNVNSVSPSVISSNETICAGGNPIAFTNTTAATGSGTLSYQWQSSTVSAVAGFSNIVGATGPTYDPPVLNATTYYQVIVTSTLNGILCTATSNPLTVTVNNVSAGTLSQSQTICSGGNALAFTTITAATGTGTLSYQWQSSTVSAVAGFSNMVGETNPTFDPPAGQTVTTFYQLVVTSTLNGIVCTATSNVLSVSVNNIAASVIATNQTICSGGNPAAFTNTTAATGTGTLSYVWQSSTVSAVAGFNPIVGATSSTYDPPAGLNTTTYYQVIITSTLNGVSCNAISNPVTVHVNSVAAQTVASNQTICSNGDPVAFTVTTPSVGAGSLSYQWQVSTTGVAVGYTNIAGETNPTYDVPAGLNTTSYYQVITSSVLNGVTCTSTSNPLTVTVTAAPSIQNVNSTLCSGGILNVVPANGAGNIVPAATTYTWTVSNNPNLTGQSNQNIGQNSITQTLINTTLQTQTLVYTVTPLAGVCQGIPFTINVTVNPAALVPAQTATICSGTAFSIVPVNAPPQVIVPAGTTYSWGVPVSSPLNAVTGGSAANNQVNISQSLTNLTVSPSTLTYTVTPNSGNCPGTSFQVVITVNPAPVVTFSPVNQSICSGTNSTLVTLSSTTPNVTFSWQAVIPNPIGNVNPASGSGNIPSFTNVTNASNTIQTIQFTATASTTGTVCMGPAANYTISVIPIPVANPINNATYCNGIAVPQTNLTSNVPNTTFSWNMAPSIGLTPPNNTSSTIPGYNASIAGNVPITSTVTVIPSATTGGISCQGASVTYTVTVNPIPNISAIQNQVLCAGNSSTAVNLSGNVAGTVYGWTNNNTNTGLSATGNNVVQSFVAANATNAPTQSVVTVTPTFTNNGVACIGVNGTFNITVNPVPVVNAVQNQQVCDGNAVAVNFGSVSNIAGTVYNWTNSNASIGLGGQGLGNIAFNATNNTNAAIVGNLVVTPSYANAGVSCPGQVGNFTITVLPTPVANPLQSQTLCAGTNSLPFTFGSNQVGTVFNWTNSNATIGLAANGSGNIAAFQGVNATNAPITSLLTVTPSLTTNAQACPGASVATNITLNPNPVMTAPVSQSYCQGSNVSYSFNSNIANGVTYAWTNSNPSIGLAASGNGNIAFVAQNGTSNSLTGTITVTPTYLSNGVSCTGIVQTFTIQVIPSPTVDAVQNLTLCNGSQSNVVSFTSPVANTTFSWTNANANVGLAVSGNGAIPIFTATNASSVNVLSSVVSVTATVVVNGVTCIGTPLNFNINVNPNTTINPVANVTLCNGASSSVISFGGTGNAYAWTNSNTGIGLGASGSTNVASFNATNAGNAAITGTVTVTSQFTGGGITCNGAATNFTITINPTPTVTPPTNVVICNGATVNSIPFVGTAIQYNWTNSIPGIGLAASGTGNTPSFTAVNATPNPIVATLNVTPNFINNNVTCSGTVQSFTITVNPAPAVNFSIPNQTICSGASSTAVTITSPTPNAVITWNATTVPVSISGVNTVAGNATIPTFTLINNSATAQVIQFLGNANTAGALSCPGGGVAYTITVNPTPAVASPNNQVLCAGSPTTAVTFTGNANVFNWSNNTTSIGLAASASGNIASFNALNNGIAPVTATVTVTPQFLNNNVGCNGTPVVFTLTVNPIPTTNPLSNLTFCNGTNSSLVTLSGNGSTYAWTNSNQSIGLGALGTGNIAVFPAQNLGAVPIIGNISVTPTFTNAGVSCLGASTPFTITVNPTPTVNPIQNQVVCNNAPTAAVQFAGSGTSYNWSNTQTNIGLGASAVGNIASFTAVNASNANPLSGTVTVTPVFTNNGVACQGSPQNFTITINPTPTLTVPQNQVVCNGASTSQVVFSGTGTQYNWTNNTTSIGLAASASGTINSFTAANATVNAVVAQVSVIPVFSGGNVLCAGTPQNFTITVNPSPSAVQPQNQVVCNGASVAAINFSGTATSYDWTNNTPGIGLATTGSGNIAAFNAVNNTSNPITATITVQPIFNGANLNCPGVAQTFTITINPTPAMGALGNQVLCSGTSTNPINFTGTASNYAWVNNTPGIGLAANGNGNIAAFSATNASNAVALTGSITVTPQFVNAGVTCAGANQVMTITVNPTPILTPTQDLTFCNGASTTTVSFTGTATNYAWVSNNPGIGSSANGNGNLGSFVAGNGGIQPVNATFTVTSTFTANGVSCAGINDVFVITVNPTPTLNPLANQVLCNGSATSNVNFTGAVAGTVYNWTNNTTSIGLGASGNANIPAFNAINNSANPVIAQVNVVPSFSNNNVTCSGTAQNFTITVNPTPTVNFSILNQTICSQNISSTVTITSPTNGANITWTAPNVPATITGFNTNSGGSTIPAFTLTNSSAVPQTIQILASATTPGNVACPGGGTAYTITVNPTPVATLPGNQVVCHNANTAAVNFTGTGTSYQWANSNAAIGLGLSGNGNIASFVATNPSSSVISTATITVTPQFVNNAVNCTGQVQSFTITINPIPTVSSISNSTFCNGVNTTLVTINGTGTSYAWTNNNQAIGLASSGSGNIAPFPATNATSTPLNATIGIIPSFTNAGVTCAGSNANFTITVNPTPTVNNVNPQVICHNTNTSAIVFSGTGTAYNWTNNTLGIGILGNGSGNIPSFTGINNSNQTPVIATITVTPEFTNNAVTCPGASGNFTITINPIPVANAPASQTLCNGTSTSQVTFTGTGTSYNWTNSIATIGIGATGTGNINSFVAINNAINPITAQLAVTPIFTGNGVACAGIPQNFGITINPTPTVILPPNQVVCNTQLTNPVNFSGNGTSYTWTNNTPSIGLATTSTGNIAAFSATNASQVPVTATISVMPNYAGGNASCPGVSQNFTITVNPTPVVNPLNSQILCNNTSTQPIVFSGTASNYSWANNTAAIGLLASGSGNIAAFTALNASNAAPLVATLTVTPQYVNAGLTCAGATTQMTFTVNPTPIVNAISNLTVCNGSNTPVVNFAGTGTSYDWTNSNPNIGLPPSGTANALASFPAVNPSVQPVNATITVTPQFTANGLTCQGTNTTFTLTVNPTPNVSAPNNQTVCNGSQTAQVNFAGTVPNTIYNWTNSIPTVGINATGSGNIAPFAAVNNSNAPIFAQVTITPQFILNSVSCGGTPQSFTIQVNPTPTANNPGSQYVCAGSNSNNIVLTGTATTYQWTAASTATGIPPNGNNVIAPFLSQNNTNAPISSLVSVTPIFSQGISCPGAIQTFTFYVIPIPSVAPINNQAFCHQTAVPAAVINGTGTSYNWTNSNPNIGLVANGANTINGFNATNPSMIPGANPLIGNIAITPIYTFQGQSCNGPVSTYSITVNPLPHVNAMFDTVICNHGVMATNIGTNIPSTISWYATQNLNVNGELTTTQTSNFINDSLTNITNTPQTVTYTITPTSLNGCVGPDSILNVQIQPDVVLTMPTNLEICSGSGVNSILGANIPSNFQWFVTVNNPNVTGESLLTNNGAVINDILVNTSNVNQVVVYAVTPVSIQGGCTGTTQTVTVIVKPPLALLNQDTLTICSNDFVNLNLVANTNVTFNWYADPTATVLNETTNITTSSMINDQLVNTTGTVQTVDYHVIGTSIANGCSSPVIPITVFVNPIPVITPVQDLNLCRNIWSPQVLFTGNSPGTVYSWNAVGSNVGLPSSNGIDSLYAFLATNNGFAPVMSTVNVIPTFTNNNVTCTGIQDQFTITVNPEPSVFAINNLTFCEGAQSGIIAFSGPIGGTTFNWSNSNASIGLGSVGTGDIPSFTGTNNTPNPIQSNVVVTPAFVNGNATCFGQTQNFTVVVNSAPNVLNQDIQICPGENTNINLTSDLPSTFNWYATPNAFVYNETSNPLQTSNSIQDNLVQTGTVAQVVQYHVIPISTQFGCSGPDSIINVTVNPWPVVAFTGMNPPYCDLTPISFQNNSVGILDYVWDFGDGLTSYLDNPTHQFPAVGTYNVTLTATNPVTGCVDSIMHPIYIAPSPNAAFNYSDSIGCGMLNVVYTAQTYNASWNYLWNFGNGQSATQVGQVGYQFSEQGCYDISLTVTNPQGCAVTETYFNVACVYETPIALFAADPTVVSSLNPLVEFTNNSQFASSYEWDFGDGTYGFSEDQTHMFPPYAGDYLVALTAFNQVGCSDTAWIRINVTEDLIFYVPNTFTPNDDEKNQEFKPILSQGFKPGTYLLRIFNRWGELIFESKDQEVGWDGSYGPNSINSEIGTYTWVLTFQVLQTQEDKEIVGHVNLIR